jgi:hypothetical protein
MYSRGAKILRSFAKMRKYLAATLAFFCHSLQIANMKFNKLPYFICMALFLAACGAGSITVGDFPPITKTEGDAPFTLKAPTSISPAGFTYSSSDPKVATISGSTVTIVLAGTTTITASQAPTGSYGSSSTTAVLTVNPIVCTAPKIRQNGICVTVPICTSPASLENNVCVAPASATGNDIVSNGVSWMSVTFTNTWTNANAYCTTTTINGLAGWRLPTEFELKALYTSGKMNGKNWTLGSTWSSTTAIVAGYVDARPVAISLSDGTTRIDTTNDGAYVACVR